MGPPWLAAFLCQDWASPLWVGMVSSIRSFQATDLTLNNNIVFAQDVLIIYNMNIICIFDIHLSS